jgi:hypothetical protein
MRSSSSPSASHRGTRQPFPPLLQKTFADSLKLDHPLLSDHPDLKVIRSYGILQHMVNEPSRLAARLALFLIAQEGVVRGRWLPEKQAELFPSEPIFERVREITGLR